MFHSQSFNDSESEDVLHTVNPNEVFNESDSGASDIPDPTHCLTLATPTVYQVVYDLSGVGGEQQKQQKVDVISIELGVYTKIHITVYLCYLFLNVFYSYYRYL